MRFKKNIYHKDLVSVIVVTYNQDKYIEECLSSICNQTYRKLEIIVCDDCSNDNTQEIILKLSSGDDRIIPFFSEINEGLSKNFNKGLYIAKGEFLSYVGGDDIFLPEKIEKQVNFLRNHPDYDVTLHWVEFFDSDSGRIETVLSRNILNNPVDWLFKRPWFGRFFCPNNTFPPTAYLARSNYALNSYYDERLPYKNEVLFALDNYVSSPGSKWHIIPEVLGRYRRHDNNMSSSPSMNDKLLEEWFIYYGIAVSRYPLYRKQLKRSLVYFLFQRLAYNHVQHESLNDAKALLLFESNIFIYLYYKIILYKNFIVKIIKGNLNDTF